MTTKLTFICSLCNEEACDWSFDKKITLKERSTQPNDNRNEITEIIVCGRCYDGFKNYTRKGKIIPGCLICHEESDLKIELIDLCHNCSCTHRKELSRIPALKRALLRQGIVWNSQDPFWILESVLFGPDYKRI